jgi:beta-phosphoglucomutase family hydrolase
MNRVKAVIWDMDGVIVDTGVFHCSSWQYAFQQEGIIFTEDDFKQIFGKRNDFIIRNILGKDIPQSRIEKVEKVKEDYFRQAVRQNVKPFPGVVNLLNVLKENGIAAAIASSAPLENILLILNSLRVKDYFQAIVYGQEVSEGKPSPLIFLLAAKKLDAEPVNTIVIEDAVAGVTGAKKAGMKCLAVTNTHAAGDLKEADLVVESLQKIGLNELEMLIQKKI